MATTMRAKFMVIGVESYEDSDGKVTSEKVTMQPVTGHVPFGKDGESEDNTYARWTPSGLLWLTISNPNLIGKYVYGQTFYSDFTPADD